MPPIDNPTSAELAIAAASTVLKASLACSHEDFTVAMASMVGAIILLASRQPNVAAVLGVAIEGLVHAHTLAAMASRTPPMAVPS